MYVTDQREASADLTSNFPTELSLSVKGPRGL